MGNVVSQARGPLLVLGAAGTGKTSALVEAAVERARRGLPPALVLALTRRAASSLRDRIVRESAMTTLTPPVMTVHAFCRTLLARYADSDDAAAGLLTAPEQEYRIAELLRGAPAGWPEDLSDAVPTRAFAGQVRGVLARARQLGLDPDDVVAAARAAGEPGWERLAAFMEEYLDVLDTEGALDYAELVHRARLLLERPEVLASVRAQVPAVWVDDWCELDPAQMALVRVLAPEDGSVVALADPDTAIYRFRGAHPRAVQEFLRLFGAGALPATIVTLGAAHRHGPAVTAALGSVARRLGVPAGVGGDVAAYRSPSPAGQGRVEVVTLPTAQAQARHVAAELRAASLEAGLAWSDMAVLMRSGRQIPGLVQALVDAGIPVEVAGDEIGLAAELAVRPLLLGLQVAARGGVPDPDEAVRLLTSGWGGLDAVALRQLGRALRAADAEATRVPSAQLVAEALGGRRAVPEGHPVAQRRDVLARAAREVGAGARPDEVLWTLWSGTPWPEQLRSDAVGGGEASPRANRDLDAVVALFGIARDSQAPGGEAGVRWFLAEVAAQQIPADMEREAAVAGRGVRVLTAHRSKGRHWPFVVVAGVQEGVWPDVRRRGSVFDAQRLTSAGLGVGTTTADLVAAERRLFMLGCSRTEGRLLVTAVEGTEGEDDRPSRFLTELGVPIRAIVGPEPRLHTLRALVASLRGAAQDEGASPGLRRAAAARLAALADAVDDRGRPLVPDADPDRWWGVRAVTAATAPARVDRPVTLSPSQLESVLRCPRQYFLLREARADRPRSSTTILGSVIHVVAERAATGDLDAAGAKACLDDVWAEIPFPAAWLSASERVEADLAIERLLAWQQGHDYAEIVGVEVPFSVPLEVEGGSVVLAGTVDRLERTADSRLRVVDFKTGRSRPTAADAARLPQLGAYQVAVEAGAFDAIAPGCGRSAGASVVYLRHEDGEGWPRVLGQPALSETPHLSDDPAELAHPTWVHHLVAQARRVLVEGRFDARAGEHCRWCPVASSCPARSGQVVA